MSKLLKLEFDLQGRLANYDFDEIRQGDNGVVVQAQFAGRNNINYIARLNFTRPDTKHMENVLMVADPSSTTKYTKTLDSLWYFEKNGTATLTVFLTDGSGSQLAYGQVTIPIQQTDYSGDTTITPDEYNDLLSKIAAKLDIVSGIVRLSAIGSLADFQIGQILYLQNANEQKLLRVIESTSGKTIETLYDFITSGEDKIVDAEVSKVETGSTITYTISLLTADEEVVTSFDIEIQSATTTKAGLMSANDKSTLNAIPSTYETQQHASQTYETKAEALEEHDNIQSQIDAIVSKSDIVDIVGTYADLVAYDTSKLTDNDIIKVLDDSEHEHKHSYYRFDKDLTIAFKFVYIGSESAGYTKAETDLIFLKKVDAQSTYQTKITYSQTAPQNPQVGDMYCYESFTTDYLIGTGLKTTESGGSFTLSIDSSVVALKTDLTAKLDASKCTFQTTAPTSAISDGGVHIVYLTSEPTTKYNGYIYLIKE